MVLLLISLDRLEIELFANRAVWAGPLVGDLVPFRSGREAFPGIAFGLVVDVFAHGALVGGHHAATPYLASTFFRSRGCTLTLVMSPSECASTRRALTAR